jgi:hypothetical protein
MQRRCVDDVMSLLRSWLRQTLTAASSKLTGEGTVEG